MIARTCFLALTGLCLCGFAAPPAAGADFGISFRYSSYRPSCYSSAYYSPTYRSSTYYCSPRCSSAYYSSPCYDSVYYSSYYPPTRVYYDDDYCYAPVVYRVSPPPPPPPPPARRVVYYDDCYPTTYRTTYTSSECYARPVQHRHASIHYSSGHRQHQHHYRVVKTHRPSHHATRSSRAYTSHHGVARSHSGHTYTRQGSSIKIHRDSRHGSHQQHHRTPRIRITRR